MLLFLLLLSITGGVFYTSSLFLDPLNEPKVYLLLITSLIMLIICFASKNGLQNIQRSLSSHGLIIGIVVICFLSSLLGLFQYLGVIRSNHSFFPITGTFENPAGFAAVQSCMFPFVSVNCFEKKRRRFEIISSIIVSVFCVLTVILSGSRAGMLAVSSSIIITLAFQRKVRWCFYKYKWLWILLLIVILSLVVLLYSIKPDSANGRWFIWNRCFDIIKEHPLFGNGPDGFHKLYMEHQADYFRVHPDSPYVMIADNVRHPFNELIKLTVQYGILGLLLAIGLLLLLIHKLLKSEEQTKIVGLSFIASIFVLSQFSYPFNYSVVWFFSFVTITSGFITPGTDFRFPKILRYSVISILLFLMFFTTRYMYYEMKFTEVTKRAVTGKARRMVQNYENIDRTMRDNPLFKYNYAVLLNGIGRYEESLYQITECEKKWNEYSVQMLTADILEHMGKEEDAIQAFEEAHYMVPCRFEPIYGQFLIYCNCNDTINIVRTAYEIIEKPRKVPSERINQIVSHANQVIDNVSL